MYKLFLFFIKSYKKIDNKSLIYLIILNKLFKKPTFIQISFK